MKKIIALIFLMCAYICVCPSTYARTNTDIDKMIADVVENNRVVRSGKLGDNLEWKKYGDDTLIITGEGDMADMEIKENPWYHTNVHYDYYWNPSYETSISDISTIIIGNGVTSIGKNAFYRLEYVKKVVLPDGLTKIGRSAFWGCIALCDIEIPDSVEEIDWGAFGQCKKLQKINIPKSLKELNTIFTNTSITSIEIPPSVTKINGAFVLMEAIKEINIPDTVKEINGDFSGCKQLRKITYPDSAEWTGLCLGGCLRLEDFLMPRGITKIEMNMFSSCDKLETIILPDAQGEIGKGAFGYSKNLKTVVLPEGITMIGKDAFKGCLSLEKVYFGGTYAQWVTMRMSSGNELLNNAEIICDVNMDDFIPKKPLEESKEEIKETEEIDVTDASGWAAEYIKEAIRNNLVPLENQKEYKTAISREECSELIYRLMCELGLIDNEETFSKSFDDTDNIAVIALAEKNIVYGKTENSFSPQDLLTREQFAAILARVCRASGVETAKSEKVEFKDKDKISAWAISDVGMVKENGIMVGDAENNFNPKLDVKKEEVIVTVLKLYNLKIK